MLCFMLDNLSIGKNIYHYAMLRKGVRGVAPFRQYSLFFKNTIIDFPAREVDERIFKVKFKVDGM